ncbi:E3 ubiquitin-protein ligase TRIM39-like isoform X1 [Stegostoma tigrinum]|uniref:E3 ubiquitin-protein ligase TRIM39-like isoform X1 n=1 Tax=Stegostoma tigrinum TaxID=3053191 RepID=UPI00286FE40A|nr:E3 ubiquitin-protein ligase TRIM39-like isoform X1 [Stegostoma tigrinum]
MLSGAVCPLCLDFYRNPVKSPCGHSFCRSCLMQHPGQGQLQCPQCEQAFAQSSVRTDRSRRRRADRARQQVRRLTEEQALFGEQGAGACRIQPSSSMKEVAEMYKEMLRNKLGSLQKQREHLDRCQGTEEANRVELKKYVEDLRENIISEFAELKQFLRSEEAALIARLEEKQTVVSREIEDNMIKISTDLAAINQTISKVESLLALQEAELLQDMRSNVKWSRVEYQGPKTLSVSLALGEFSGPVQYTVWRRMLKEIKTVPVPVVIDPKTAHPHLSLSADCRRLHAASGKQQSRRPCRFGRCLCALGSEGFTSGTVYWEVKVRTNWEWVIGVAPQAIVGLKGRGPEGRVWALRRSGEEYSALTSPHTPLHLSVKPQKIGVYLDYQAGQLSFYNADDMSHLYTFTETFSEELYPYFYTGCKMDPLKLVSLRF